MTMGHTWQDYGIAKLREKWNSRFNREEELHEFPSSIDGKIAFKGKGLPDKRIEIEATSPRYDQPDYALNKIFTLKKGDKTYSLDFIRELYEVGHEGDVPICEVQYGVYFSFDQAEYSGVISFEIVGYTAYLDSADQATALAELEVLTGIENDLTKPKKAIDVIDFLVETFCKLAS